MKNYRNFIPILAILLMVASIYTMVNESIAKNDNINNLLLKAKQCEEQELYDQAVSYYNEVINLDNKVEYYTAITDMLYDAGQYDYAQEWCETTIGKHPNETKPYEQMVQVCLQTEQFSKAFSTIDDFDGRKMQSDVIEKYRKEIEYLNYVDSISYDSAPLVGDGYMSVAIKDKWALTNLKGANIVQPKFLKMGVFANNLIPVCDDKNNWYFMNNEGVYIQNISASIHGNITDVGMYNNELFYVCVDGLYSFYDMSFNKRFGDYEFAGSFNNGVAAVKKDGGWKIINTEGNAINEMVYEDIVLDERGICCNKNRIFVKIKDEYIMTDNTGTQVGSQYFSGACVFSTDDFAAVLKDGLWGFVNLDGDFVIEAKYEGAKSFSNGLAAVCNDGVWGYINHSEMEVIEPQYVECSLLLSNGRAYVKDDSGWNLLKFYKYNH